MQNGNIYSRYISINDRINLEIFQEIETDVGGVVWDSALVASYYFIKHPFLWEGKKVLELGAGTGLCGLVLGALGADVILTDLATRLPLLKKNLAANISLLRGEVSVKVLDWCSHVSISDVDLLVLVDCLYYRSSVQPLIDTIKSCNASEILCVYEKRDIGEPLVAQQMFIQLVSKYYELNYVPDYELDPNYCSGDIPVIKLVKK